MEPKEAISPGEEAFERWRKRTGIFLGPAVFMAVYFAPLTGLSPEAHKLLSVVSLVIIFWLTEALPLAITALIGAILNVLLGVGSAEAVFSPFANPMVFLFIGSFIIAEAISMHGVDRRFSFAILSIRFIGESPGRVLFAFGLISALISMWISNSAATAMMLPIALGAVGAMKAAHQRGWRNYASSVMLILSYGASVGGIATPIGSPPNLIGIGMIESITGLRISFFDWMALTVPISAVMFVYLFFTTWLGKERRFVPASAAVAQSAPIGRWSRAEINTAVCFSIAVFLWLLPSAVELLSGRESPLAAFLSSRLDEGVVALLAASLLFILPVSLKEGSFTMTWKRAANIDWGTIILFGGGLSIGKLMFSTGLASAFGGVVVDFFGVETVWAITAVSIAVSIVLSETTSNTATASMAVPVVIAIAHGAGVSAIPPALGATLGASFGFMLPVSTPPNAIVYGSGLVPLVKMLKRGALLDIGGFIIILAGLMILCPLFGWAS
jgi:sodium-dependent dicarboxylate transporter 2/3/5